jgi:nucleotide-binding universal stress UspA family protein
MTTPGKEHLLVVGVDGSPPSQCALRWAVRQAELVGGAIAAIAVWNYPVFYGLEAAAPAFDEIQHGAEETLAEAVAGVDTPVRIRQQVIQGNPAQVLLEAAANADLLVVGSRGHGGFTGALLGSVSQHCAQHSQCPVVIVRELRE